MTYTRVGATTPDNRGAASSRSIAVPSGVMAGDLMFAYVYTSASGAVSATGWTLAHAQRTAAGANDATLSVLTRTAGSGEPASYSFAHPFGYSSGGMVVVRGASQLASGSNDGSVAASPATHDGDATITLPSPVADAAVLQFMACGAGSTAAPYSGAGTVWHSSHPYLAAQEVVAISAPSGAYIVPALTHTAGSAEHGWASYAVILEPAAAPTPELALSASAPTATASVDLEAATPPAEGTLAAVAAAASATFEVAATVDYAAEVLADAPVLYWRLDETAGTVAADASGNGWDGEYIGTPTLGDPGLVQDGTSVFLGAGDYINRVGDPALYLTEFTVESWFTSTVAATTRTLVDKPSDYNISVYSTDIDGGLLRASRGSTLLFSTAPVNDGQRHHVAITQDATTFALYIDGVLHDSAARPADSSGVVGGIVVGENVSPDRDWDGHVDEFAIYPSALSASRIAAHYDAGIGTTLALAGVAATPTAEFTLTATEGVQTEATTTDKVNRANGRTRVMAWAVVVEPPIVPPTRELGHDYAVAASLPDPTLVNGRPT